LLGLRLWPDTSVREQTDGQQVRSRLIRSLVAMWLSRSVTVG